MDWMLMPFRRYADFSGRSRRQEYWSWVLLQVIVGIGFLVLMMIVGGSVLASGSLSGAASGGIAIMLIGLLELVWALACLVPNIAVTVRRLHDTNRSGWWILAPLVPYLVALFSMVGGISSGSGGGMAAAGMIGLLCILAAGVLGLVVLVFMFLEGTPGPNRFGADPKGRTEAATFA
jgi:uncharacterized membrane protein YhaH (DUF805 family)